MMNIAIDLITYRYPEAHINFGINRSKEYLTVNCTWFENDSWVKLMYLDLIFDSLFLKYFDLKVLYS